MSYRCQLCRGTVPQGVPMLRRVTYRTDGQIERETAVCERCHLDGNVAVLVASVAKNVVATTGKAPRHDFTNGRPTPVPRRGLDAILHARRN